MPKQPFFLSRTACVCVFFRSFCRHFSYDNDKYLPDNMNNKAEGSEGERRGHIRGRKKRGGGEVERASGGWSGGSAGGCGPNTQGG